MPRPRPGYVRPTVVQCEVCAQPVDVPEVGRIPQGHAECMVLSQDVGRVFRALGAALETATDAADTARIRELHRWWNARVASDANSVWNRYDNPAKRAAAARRGG